MSNGVPSVESVWQTLLGMLPTWAQPLVAPASAIAVLLWLAFRGLKAILDVVKTMEEIKERRRKLATPIEPTEKVELKPARVSVWTFPVNDPPRPLPNSIPIVTVVNMKGGVGKTTLTANLAAYLDAKGKGGRGARVLLIDFDYQGSLSQTVLASANNSRMVSVVDDLIRGTRTMGAILEGSQTLYPALANSRILTCYYEFSDTETHEMVDWIIATRSGQSHDDVRFRLARLLQSDAVQSQFDYVLIDAPPRFSTGAINALCASTHLLVPTVLDQMSAEAVVYFSRDVTAMKKELFPDIKLVGVIPTLVYQATGFGAREERIIDYINASVRPFWGVKDSVLKDAFVPRKNAIGDISGDGIGYVNAGDRRSTRDVQTIFDRVGAILEARISQ